MNGFLAGRTRKWPVIVNVASVTRWISEKIYNGLKILKQLESLGKYVLACRYSYLLHTVAPSSVDFKHFSYRAPVLDCILICASPVNRTLVNKGKPAARSLGISTDCMDTIFTVLNTKLKELKPRILLLLNLGLHTPTCNKVAMYSFCNKYLFYGNIRSFVHFSIFTFEWQPYCN